MPLILDCFEIVNTSLAALPFVRHFQTLFRTDSLEITALFGGERPKTTPYPAARPHTGHIWECPPPPQFLLFLPIPKSLPFQTRSPLPCSE